MTAWESLIFGEEMRFLGFGRVEGVLEIILSVHGCICRLFMIISNKM